MPIQNKNVHNIIVVEAVTFMQKNLYLSDYLAPDHMALYGHSFY